MTPTAEKTKPGSELPGMPVRPELRTPNGKLIEHAVVGLTGGVSVDLKTQDAIDYISQFNEEDVVTLIVHGRVKSIGTSSQQLKEGTLLTKRVTIGVDYIEGAPNELADAMAATAADDAE